MEGFGPSVLMEETLAPRQLGKYGNIYLIVLGDNLSPNIWSVEYLFWLTSKSF